MRDELQAEGNEQREFCLVDTRVRHQGAANFTVFRDSEIRRDPGYTQEHELGRVTLLCPTSDPVHTLRHPLLTTQFTNPRRNGYEASFERGMS